MSHYHKQRLDKQSLDLFPGTKRKTSREYPFLIARSFSCSSPIVSLCAEEWQQEIPAVIHDNDWIPSKLAALVVGISKQAISDRIRRGTIPARSTCQGGRRAGRSVQLVQLMHCRKQKKAGRPKGSKAKVKELWTCSGIREGVWIPNPHRSGPRGTG